MKNQRRIVIFLVLIILFLVIFLGVKGWKKGKLRDCPEEWYKNEIPTVGEKIEKREYFIYKGERRETEEFDIDWVKKNCQLWPKSVF